MPRKAATAESEPVQTDSFLTDLQAEGTKDEDNIHSPLMDLSADHFEEVNVVSSGNEAVNYAIGVGGWPLGRFHLIYGKEGGGKTTLALQAIAEAQKAGGFGLYLDGEHKLSLPYAFDGLGVDPKRFGYAQTDGIEESISWVEKAAHVAKAGKNDAPIVVVIDSISALSPKVELEGKNMPGMHALAWSSGLRRAVKVVGHESRVMVMMISQERAKIGVMFGDPNTTSGGKAPRFYSTVVMEVSPYKAIIKDGQKVGNHVKGVIVKNQVASPFRECELQLRYGKGFDYPASLYDTLRAVAPDGFIEGKNQWIDMELDGEKYRFQGLGGFTELIEGDADLIPKFQKIVRGR